MALQPSCIFCQILMGQAEASFIYRDKFVTSFMDIRPLIRGHLLVIPNDHFATLTELDDPYGPHMFEVARKLAQAIHRSGVRSEGVNLFMADGAAAGQTIFHSHLHVIPRFRGDGFKINFPASYGTRPSREELDELARQIQDKLDFNQKSSRGS